MSLNLLTLLRVIGEWINLIRHSNMLIFPLFRFRNRILTVAATGNNVLAKALKTLFVHMWDLQQRPPLELIIPQQFRDALPLDKFPRSKEADAYELLIYLCIE